MKVSKIQKILILLLNMKISIYRAINYCLKFSYFLLNAFHYKWLFENFHQVINRLNYYVPIICMYYQSKYI